MFASLLRNAKGGIDDALGLVLEVSLFAIIFVFAAVLIGSATAQAMSEVVANHLAAIEISGNTALMAQEAASEPQQFLDANTVAYVGYASLCGSASACVVAPPCSSASPACVVIVERRVMIPIVDTPVVWSAKAVAIWQPGA